MVQASLFVSTEEGVASGCSLREGLLELRVVALASVALLDSGLACAGRRPSHPAVGSTACVVAVDAVVDDVPQPSQSLHTVLKVILQAPAAYRRRERRILAGEVPQKGELPKVCIDLFPCAR